MHGMVDFMDTMDRFFIGFLAGLASAVALLGLLFGLPDFGLPYLGQPWATVLTGGCAILAAAIAFRGATAKVAFDREVDARNRADMSLRALIRMRYAAQETEGVLHHLFMSISDKNDLSDAAIALKATIAPKMLEDASAEGDRIPPEISKKAGELLTLFSEIKMISGMAQGNRRPGEDILVEIGYLCDLKERVSKCAFLASEISQNIEREIVGSASVQTK